MRVIALSLFPFAITFFAVGCHAPPAPTGPTEMTLRISDREEFFDNTLTLLRERDFAPEYVDRVDGTVITQPSTGQQWFEVWRHDSIGAYQLLESSINTIRRIVTVRVTPAEPGEQSDDFNVSVRVDKERYSAPERQVTTASGALAIYSERLPTMEGLMAARTAGEHWVPLGRDSPLERYLIEEIADLSSGSSPVAEVEEPTSEPSESAPETS